MNKKYTDQEMDALMEEAEKLFEQRDALWAGFTTGCLPADLRKKDIEISDKIAKIYEKI